MTAVAGTGRLGNAPAAPCEPRGRVLPPGNEVSGSGPVADALAAISDPPAKAPPARRRLRDEPESVQIATRAIRGLPWQFRERTLVALIRESAPPPPSATRRPGAGRKSGTTEASALLACAKLGGEYRAFARARVLALVAGATSVRLALAVALDTSTRNADRILSAIDGGRR